VPVGLLHGCDMVASGSLSICVVLPRVCAALSCRPSLLQALGRALTRAPCARAAGDQRRAGEQVSGAGGQRRGRRAERHATRHAQRQQQRAVAARAAARGAAYQVLQLSLGPLLSIFARCVLACACAKYFSVEARMFIAMQDVVPATVFVCW
jgi:hypothetical protein